MELSKWLKERFNLRDAVCENLNTPTNDIVAVTTPTGRFALKLYNPQSRRIADVQWEVDFIVHLLKNGAPVVRPISSKDKYAETYIIEGQERAAVLFEWAKGEKPKPSENTYELLGKAAGQIHDAADTFASSLPREGYDTTILIDDQLRRMKDHLIAAERWEKIMEMGERLKRTIANPVLDKGICHMDLTLDNVFQNGDVLTVFDFDSAGACWRAIEPHKVLRLSKEYFMAWLRGYRTVRPFAQVDEGAVAAFAIIGDLRVVAWDLGVARSSRGTPKLGIPELKSVADGWLDWERKYL